MTDKNHALTFTPEQIEAGRAYFRADAEYSRADEAFYDASHKYTGEDVARTKHAQQEQTRTRDAFNAATDQDRRLRGAIEYYLTVVLGERY